MSLRATPPSSGLVGALFADIGGPSMPVKYVKFDDEGLTTIDDVAPGRYQIYVLRRDGVGTVGRAGPRSFDGGEIRVPLEEPGRLRIRPVAPETASDWKGLVFAHGEPIGDVESVDGGLLESPDLPPGRYAVSVFAKDGTQHLEGRVHAETGTEAAVEMAPME
jgi:hypothetical protein